MKDFFAKYIVTKYGFILKKLCGLCTLESIDHKRFMEFLIYPMYDQKEG